MNRDVHMFAFTLTELLVTMTVLASIVLLMARLFTNATTVATSAMNRIDCDLQARQLFERMSIDLAEMVRRPDVDYYVKSNVDPELGNDRIAFFTQVPGYYPSTGSPSPVSLVAYRVNGSNTSNAFNRLERMGKGLVWNGVSPSQTPLIFGLTTIVNNWPEATNDNSVDQDYETIGPQIFRFEYYYLMKDGSLAVISGAPGMQDVEAICVCVASIDAKSKVVLTSSQLTTLAGNMKDFDVATFAHPGDLIAQWQGAVDSASDIPRAARAAIRLYQRAFHFTPKY
jgi:hypothetical protein